MVRLPFSSIFVPVFMPEVVIFQVMPLLTDGCAGSIVEVSCKELPVSTLVAPSVPAMLKSFTGLNSATFISLVIVVVPTFA